MKGRSFKAESRKKIRSHRLVHDINQRDLEAPVISLDTIEYLAPVIGNSPVKEHLAITVYVIVLRKTWKCQHQGLKVLSPSKDQYISGESKSQHLKTCFFRRFVDIKLVMSTARCLLLDLGLPKLCYWLTSSSLTSLLVNNFHSAFDI